MAAGTSAAQLSSNSAMTKEVRWAEGSGGALPAPVRTEEARTDGTIEGGGVHDIHDTFVAGAHTGAAPRTPEGKCQDRQVRGISFPEGVYGDAERSGHGGRSSGGTHPRRARAWTYRVDAPTPLLDCPRGPMR